MVQSARGLPSPGEIESYIREVAAANGIDPDIAVRVAASEGLYADPNEAWQSNVVKNGKRERSYGPYQLYIDGGLGNEFMDETGLDPRDPTTWREQVDFSLGEAAQGGWTPWYGAKRVGISPRQGIGGASTRSTQQPRRAALGDDAERGIDDERSGFEQWYDRTNEKLRGVLGMPEPDESETDEDRFRRSSMLIQNGLRLMNGGF